MQKLEDKIEDNDNYERRDTLLFSGKLNNDTCFSAQSNIDNFPATISNQANDHSCEVTSPNDISVLHRLSGVSRGPRNVNPSISKFFSFKFCRRDVQIELLAASSRSKPCDIFINEYVPLRKDKHVSCVKEGKKIFFAA